MIPNEPRMVVLTLQLKVVINRRLQQKNSTRRGYAQPHILPFPMKEQRFDARVRLELVGRIEFFAHVVIDAKEANIVSTKRLRYDYIAHVSDGLTEDSKS